MSRTRFEITGEWSGYYSHQRRPVHREITTDMAFADSVRELGSIEHTDGTRLDLSVRPLDKGERAQPEIRSYDGLLRQCLDLGVRRVEDLP